MVMMVAMPVTMVVTVIVAMPMCFALRGRVLVAVGAIGPVNVFLMVVLIVIVVVLHDDSCSLLRQLI
jgi:hypothetical protein